MSDPRAARRLARTLALAGLVVACERDPSTVAPDPVAVSTPKQAIAATTEPATTEPATDPAATKPAASEPAAEPAAAPTEAGGPPRRMWTRKAADYSLSGAEREALALADKEDVVKGLFADAEVTWPPRQVLFRVYKQEKDLEVWASGDDKAPLRHVVTYRICATSGELGPKRKQGDGQVPEGFYVVDFLKPRSDYYLAFHVNYPNRRDRALRSTGSSIMIHGSCVSIGCMAMSDERIQELWVIGRGLAAGRQIQVHIFPGRDLQGLVAAAKDEALRAFWGDLAEGHRRFDEGHRLPKISSDKAGRYLFE